MMGLLDSYGDDDPNMQRVNAASAMTPGMVNTQGAPPPPAPMGPIAGQGVMSGAPMPQAKPPGMGGAISQAGANLFRASQPGQPPMNVGTLASAAAPMFQRMQQMHMQQNPAAAAAPQNKYAQAGISLLGLLGQ